MTIIIKCRRNAPNDDNHNFMSTRNVITKVETSSQSVPSAHLICSFIKPT